jgi:hypothetical protein
VPRLAFIQSISSNPISLVVTQFSFAPTSYYPATGKIERRLQRHSSGPVTPTVQALNINACRS